MRHIHILQTTFQFLIGPQSKHIPITLKIRYKIQLISQTKNTLKIIGINITKNLLCAPLFTSHACVANCNLSFDIIIAMHWVYNQSCVQQSVLSPLFYWWWLVCVRLLNKSRRLFNPPAQCRVDARRIFRIWGMEFPPSHHSLSFKKILRILFFCFEILRNGFPRRDPFLSME